MTEKNPEPSENGDAMDIADVMKAKTDVSDAHIDAGITALVSRIHELRSKAKSDGLSDDELAEAKQRRAEWDELTTEKATRATRREEADAAFDGVPDPDEGGEETEDSAETTEESEQPAEETAEETTEQQPEAVAASAETPKPNRLKLGTVTKDRTPSPAQSGQSTPPVSIVAAAGDAKHNYGAELSSDDVPEMIFNRARNIGRGSGGQTPEDYVPVASFELPRNEDYRVKPGEEVSNARKMEAVVASALEQYRSGGYQQALVAGGSPQALTAAGITMPYTIDYSVDCIGVEDRPIKSGLPGLTADRGGIQFRRDIDALGTGPASATGFWTLSNDANPTSPTTKPVWEPGGTGPTSAEVQAVTLATKFSNITSRFDPEMVAAQMKAARVAHSRLAEQVLLNSIHSQCTSTVVQPAEVSAARDLLASFDRNQAYLRNNRRTGPEVTLRTLLPYWVKDLIRMDMTRALHTSNEEWLALSDAAINTWFSNRNINVQWLLDGRGPQSAVTASAPNVAIPAIPDQNFSPDTAAGIRAMPGFPNTSGVVVLEYPIFVDGTFVFLDGGTLDVGVVRDENLVRTNKYMQFVETFEGLYRKGIEARRCVLSLNASGSSAGTITTSSLAN